MTSAAVTLSDSNDVAMLSRRLQALEVQVGLLDIDIDIDASNNNNDPTEVSLSLSSSISKINVVKRLEALEQQALNFWTTTNPSSSASSSSTASASYGSTTTTSASANNNNNNNVMISMSMAWKEIWLELERLFMELDPATALTHQQNTSTAATAPILYRRQQILCSVELLRHNMRFISQILNLLLIGSGNGASGAGAPSSLNITTTSNTSNKRTTSTGGSGGTSGTTTTSQQQQQQQLYMITEEQVVQAPILVLTTDEDVMDPERLTKVEMATYDLQKRVKVITARFDRLLASYHCLVTNFSEQVVLLEEQVRQHEKTKS